MKNRMIRVAGAALLLSLIASHPAAAVERGFYVGGFYGMNDVDADEGEFATQTGIIYNEFGFTPAQSETGFDSKDSGFGFFGGYRFSRHLAFEGGYIDTGEVSYRDSSNGVFNDGTNPPTDESWTQLTSRSVTGITLSALGIWPLNYRTELFVRGGVSFSSTEVRVRLSDSFNEASGETSESDTDWLVGVGAGYTFADIYTIRVEYQRILDGGDKEAAFTEGGPGESDVDVLSLGLTVAF